ncbi:MAG: sulfite oxidase-like oxidoreductase [Rhodospirillaceae bacterium]|nr:MAG: sulfite oxidase-like oxidoreductase [Rhodospirillaceae bacterium]
MRRGLPFHCWRPVQSLLTRVKVCARNWELGCILPRTQRLFVCIERFFQTLWGLSRMTLRLKGRDLFELFANDPEKADAVVFVRVVQEDRRGFLKGAGLATMGAMVGATIPFSRNMPGGFIPVAMAEEAMAIEGKEGLVVLGDKPLNAETPPHLLDDEVTPVSRHYIRNNGTVPDGDAATWKVSIEGEVDTPLTLSIADLKKQFEVVTAQLTIECGGNGRAFFEPKAKGGQWTYGAVGCSRWTGVRLADVLKAAKVKSTAIYTAHYGADQALDDPAKVPLSRGIPIAKAMDPHTLIAFAMNDGAMHPQNGHPLRLVVPGWVGSTSHKWLTKIVLRDKVHDGKGMTKHSYRLPGGSVEPGEAVADEAFTNIIQAMPVKSLITRPKSRIEVAAGKPLEIGGHAWAGDNTIAAVDVSIDFGATWHKASLAKPANPYAWQHWKADITFPGPGYYEVWSRATDDEGHGQPFAVAWNPGGYLNNAMHRIAVRVG